MKKLSYAIVAISILAACNNKKSDDKTAGDKTGDKKTMDNITYPYTAMYTHDFSMGDPNHAKMVLDFIKSWEDNKMKDMRPMLADTMAVDFSDGSKFMGTADSLLSMGQIFRNQFSSVRIAVDAWMPVHSNDKNEDWVLVWEKDYTTKDGVSDSIGSHAYYQIKNNKIAYWSELQSKLAAPAQMNNK